MTVIDEEFLAGCDVLHDEPVSSARYDTPEVESWRPLFPEGEASVDLADAWKALEEIQGFKTVEDALRPRTFTAGPRTASSGRDTGIADRLRAAGLKVVEIAGWQTRGSATFSPKGSVDHHTAGPRSGNAPSLNICINGRSDLPGPLCHVLIGRDNTCYVIAAGRANHAGKGGWKGIAGNSAVYGIERENVGTSAEPWRADQTEVATKAHAALIRGRGISADMVCRHAEWTPRKPDVHSINGSVIRSKVAAYLRGEHPTIPVEPPPPPPKPTYGLLDSPVVSAAAHYPGGIVSRPDGYIMAAADGGVFAFGKATFHGSLGGTPLAQPVVGIAAHPDGGGYWLVAKDGGIFAFGSAGFYGSLPPHKLNAPVVGIAATETGLGYWLAASDGGVFAFGDAGFKGSVSQFPLSAPVVAIDSTRSGQGYWLTGEDGGIFALGDAISYGNSVGRSQKIVSMVATPTEKGYWLVSEKGEFYAFGDAAVWGNPPPMQYKTTHMIADEKGGAIIGEDGAVHGAGPEPIFYGSVYDHAKK